MAAFVRVSGPPNSNFLVRSNEKWALRYGPSVGILMRHRLAILVYLPRSPGSRAKWRSDRLWESPRL